VTGKELYQVFLGMRLHFMQKSYDYPTYGPKRVDDATLGKNYVLANALARKFPNRESLEIRLISLFKNKLCWLNEISSPEAEKAESRHLSDLRGFSYNFRNHLDLIKERYPDMLSAFRVDSALTVPPIGRMLLNKEINIETYCALDYLLDFSRHIGELVWKEEKLRTEKYKAFFTPDKASIAKIAKPYFD
jgi:hypothetical protein